MKTRIFAAYLPQYYETEVNNRFWGKGFTDWVGVRNATPQYEGHHQPKIPLNENYYDLSDANTIRWQAELAKKYGIDGFSIYHYWFENGVSVLDTPPSLILENKDIDISYFFSWDNGSWIRSWSNIRGNAWAPKYDGSSANNEPEVLLRHDYGDEEDWEKHFYWLLPFFKDTRYYKIDGKPVFTFLAADNPEIIKQIKKKWVNLAKKEGLPGVYLISGVGPFRYRQCLDAMFRYQPSGIWIKKEAIIRRLAKYLHLRNVTVYKRNIDYEHAWRKIISMSQKDLKRKVYVSGIVRYDDTPRRGGKAGIIKGDTPKLFEKYFRIFYKMNRDSNMEFLLLTAWNEWGEGSYLEPDTETGYEYLEAVKRVVDEYQETTS